MHGAQTIQPTSARSVLALSSIFGFKVWSMDVKLAQLHSDAALKRAMNIKSPAQEFELERNGYLQLLKPLYISSESGDHLHKTLDDHIQDDLKMIPAP